MRNIEMADHFRWSPNSATTIPWNAQYEFPSQANKAVKMTPKIPPKQGGIYTAGSTMRLEFPAQGYINMLNTTIEFDVTLSIPGNAINATGPVGATDNSRDIVIRFQNNIQSIFNKVVVKYGSIILEEIQGYGVLVRCLSEWTAGGPSMCIDQGSVTDGVGGSTIDVDYTGNFQVLNGRSKHIQGYTAQFSPGDAMTRSVGSGPVGALGAANAPGGYVLPNVSINAVPLTCVTRRYQVSLAAGLFSQGKLMPTQYMASQFAVEITFEKPEACIFVGLPVTPIAPGFYSDYLTSYGCTYTVGNVNLIPEILEFDASYDASFLDGMQRNGISIPFASWHRYGYSSASSSMMSLVIQERSRSVKAVFAIQRRQESIYTADMGATFFDTSVNGVSSLQQYQYQVGGRYTPASPVQTSTSSGSAVSNGGAESYIELQKALNIVGDYRLSTPLNVTRWATQNSSGKLQEHDFTTSVKYYDSDNRPIVTTANLWGTQGSQCYTSAINFETSNGMEISGINAVEQVFFIF